MNGPQDGAAPRRHLHHSRAPHPGHVPLLPLLLLYGAADPEADQSVTHAGGICLQGMLRTSTEPVLLVQGLYSIALLNILLSYIVPTMRYNRKLNMMFISCHSPRNLDRKLNS